MTRALVLHGNVEWYGSDRSLALLAPALAGEGVDVVVGLPGAGGAYTPLRDAGVTVELVDPAPVRPKLFTRREWVRYALVELPRSALRVRRMARRFDVVHANTSNLLGAMLGAGLARRPLVLHVRETYAGSERAFRWYCRVVSPFVSKAIATSSDIAAEVRATRLGDRVVVVPNAVPFPVHWNAALDGPVVAIGRLNEWKGHDVLIEAIAILRRRGLEVAVEIAGDAYPGQERRAGELRALALERGVDDLVQFLGYVDDTGALLARAGMFVLPSVRPEPFGLVLVDAMARGVASIATDAGGPRDIVRDGETGLLVPRADASALADAIARLHADAGLRARLGAAAAVDVRDRFSIASTARGVATVYREVAPKR